MLELMKVPIVHIALPWREGRGLYTLHCPGGREGDCTHCRQGGGGGGGGLYTFMSQHHAHTSIQNVTI